MVAPRKGGSGEGEGSERVAAAADTGQTLKRMSGASSGREGSDGTTRGEREREREKEEEPCGLGSYL